MAAFSSATAPEKIDRRVLIVIPARNEEQTIVSLLQGLRESAPHFDRVVIDDASTDQTGRIASALGEKVLRLPTNLGYSRALQTGLKYAVENGYEIVVSMDADGQHDPVDVPLLVDTLVSRQADVVIGSRYCDGRPYSGPRGRRFGQWIFSLQTLILMRRRVFDTTSGFKALTNCACRALLGVTFVDFHVETLVRLSILGLKIEEIPVAMRERVFGKSIHGAWSAIEYPLKTVLMTAVAALDAFVARNKG